MMDFITIPLIVGMITLGIYKLFELFVRRKERILLIEKLNIQPKEPLLPETTFLSMGGKFSKGALKAGCLLLGLGLGLLIGFIITHNMVPDFTTIDRSGHWAMKQTVGIIYGASVLMCGGLGMILAFLIEMKLNKSEKS